MKDPVPSWRDVAPGSRHLSGIHANPPPVGTRHFLIHGSTDEGPFYLKSPNDGVVTVESQTDSRVARHAARMAHLPLGHMEILEADATIRLLEKYLGE